MTLSPAEIGLTAAVVLLLFALAAVLLLKTRNGSANEAVLRAQSELSGRLAQFSEHYALEQDKLARLLAEQKLSVLQMITRKVGEGLQMSAGKTDETLGALRERLAKIDAAQEKISSLSEQVVSLQEILANKQARGAFGEIQLNDLVSSILPPSAYSFQTVLGNQKRADCLLRLPNPPGAIVVDSKFPLESYQALRQAKSEREKLEAERFFKASVVKHIKDIAEKYIIPGETAESALMFLPSEAVYAELHANFADVVAFVSGINATFFSIFRISRSLGEQKVLPAIYERKFWRQGTWGNFTTTALIIAATVAFDFSSIVNLSSAAYLVSYLGIFAADWRLRKETESSPAVILVGMTLMILILVAFIVSILPS